MMKGIINKKRNRVVSTALSIVLVFGMVFSNFFVEYNVVSASDLGEYHGKKIGQSGSIGDVIGKTAYIKEQPEAENNLEIGDSVYLNVTAYNAVSYQWYKDREMLKDGHNYYYSIRNAKLEDSGEYHCVIQGLEGKEAVTNNATVTVSKKKTEIQLYVSPDYVIRPGQVNFSCGGLPSDATGTVKFYNGEELIETQVDDAYNNEVKIHGLTSSFSAKGPNNEYNFKVKYSGDDIYAECESDLVAYSFRKGTQKALTLGGYERYYTYGDDNFTVTAEGGDGNGEFEFSITNERDTLGTNTDKVATINKTSGEVSILKAGTFMVNVTKLGDDDYNEINVESQWIRVNKRSITVSGIKAKDKMYDGKNDAVLDYSAIKIKNILDLDKDSINITAVGRFDNKDVFEEAGVIKEKRVYLDYLKIDSINNERYEISTESQREAVAKISKRVLSVDFEVANKPYDGYNNAMFKESVTLKPDPKDYGDSDIGIKIPEIYFEDHQVGDNKRIQFTGTFELKGYGTKNYKLTESDISKVFANITPGFEPKVDEHYTINKADGKNDWYKTSFYIVPKNGYTISSSNDINDQWLDGLEVSSEAVKGKAAFYLRNNYTGEISSEGSVEYKLDSTSPSISKITYSKPILSKIIERITHGYYKGNVDVHLSVQELTSGLEQIDYVACDGQGVPKYKGTIKEFGLIDNEYTAKFSVPAEFKGYISIYVIDKAGNSSAINDINNILICDNIAPESNISYNKPDKIENDIHYYKKDIDVAVEIKETNFYKEDVSIIVKKTASNGSSSYIFDNDSVKAINNWHYNANDDKWVGKFTLSDDGEYEVIIDYKDRSSNEMKKYSSNKLIIDKIRPIVEINCGNEQIEEIKYLNSDQQVRINIYEHNFKKEDIVIDIKKTDSDGVEKPFPIEYNWCVDPINKDNHYVTFKAISGIYKINVNGKDMAENIIEDFSEKSIFIDAEKPKISKIIYNTPIIEKILNFITFGFYRENVHVEVTVEDKISGIDRIEYSYDAEIGSSSVNSSGKGEVSSFEQEGNVKTISFNIPAQFRGHVSVKAVDKAGNIETLVDSSKMIVVDNISPEFTVSYNKPVQSIEGREYYNTDVNVSLSVTEANFSAEDVKILVNKIDEFGSKKLIHDNKCINNWKHNAEKDKWQGGFILSDDGEYEIEIEYTDSSGNTTDKYTKQGIVIDTIKPLITNIEEFENAQEGNYHKGKVNSLIKVTERNFRQNDVIIKIKKTDGEGKDTLISPDIKWSGQGDTHIARIQYNDDSKYEVHVEYQDLACNKAQPISDNSFIIDNIKPVLQRENISFVNKNEGKVAKFINFISFGYFCNETIEVNINAKDTMSGVESITYYLDGEDNKSKDKNEIRIQNKDIDSKDLNVTFNIEPSFKGHIYAKVVDRSKNETEYIKSSGVIIESQSKHEANYEMSITPKTLPNKNGFYNSDVSFDLYIKDSYSGIEKVEYKIGSENSVTEIYDDMSKNNNDDIVYEWKKTVKLDAIKNNNNNVVVQIKYIDNAGNPKVEMQSYKLQYKVDITKPIVEVKYDITKDDLYYNKTRTASITIREMNFKNEDVRIISTKNGVEQNIKPKFSEGTDVHTMDIIYSEDGDYTLTVLCTDLAGNKSDYNRSDNFTIDKTIPTISVKYDNNKENLGYYNANRTAIITVIEHNWNPEKSAFVVHLKAEDNKTGNYVQIATPNISKWESQGDTHIATINYYNDGKYTFSAQYTDIAGNKANNIVEQVFYIDKTLPTTPKTLADINIKSYINGRDSVIAPKIVINDSNIEPSKVKILLNGSKNGNITLKGNWSNVTNGRAFIFDNFENIKNNDDIYTIKITVTDKAGNTSDSGDITFSVNRFGSTFDLKQLNTYKKGYFKSVQEFTFKELNPNKVLNNQYVLTIIRNGDIKQLQEGTDYVRESIETKGNWSSYTYTINAQNFMLDGNYVVMLKDRDEANNDSSNNEELNGELVSFSIDNTKPMVVIAGIEDGGVYSAENIKATIIVTDNIKLKTVGIELNGKEVNTVPIEDNSSSKKYGIVIPSDFNRQKLSVTLVDGAGNENSSEVKNFLINANLLVRFYQNKPLFIGTFITILLILSCLGLIIILKKKNMMKVL